MNSPIKRFAKGAAALGLVAALSGCLGIPPQGVSLEDVAEYELAAKSLGCTVVTEPDYMAIEFQTGLSREQTQAISQFLLNNERAESLEKGGIKVTSGACA